MDDVLLTGEASAGAATADVAGVAPPVADQVAPAADPAKPADTPPSAPDEYAEFTAPEGVTFDTELTGEFKGLAKELGLPQESAQKVMDLGTKLAQRAADAQAAQVKSTVEGWANESRNDKEFGGEKLGENLAIANAALKATASPALSDLLTQSGLGNHPEVIRHFLKIAPAFSEDRRAAGGRAPASGNQSTAQVLYPSTPRIPT